MFINNEEGVRSESLTLQAYRYFRHALMSGRFRPGDKIKLKEIADELGISQTPVREALGRLVSEQILSQVDRRSVQVPRLSPERYTEIRDLCWTLEGQAASRAATLASASDVQQLKALHEQYRQACETDDQARATVANANLHLFLCELADMPMLSRIVRNLWLQSGPVMNAIAGDLSITAGSPHPHLDIIRGLESRDPELAKKAIQADIIALSDPIIRGLGGQPSAEELAVQ